MKCMIIINPRAGKTKAKSLFFDITETFCKAGYEPTVMITAKKDDAAEFAKKAAGEKYDFVVCLGGDGTLNEVVSGISGSGRKIPIGYIPAGSTNDFARTMELSLDPKKAAKAIVGGESSDIDIGQFGEDKFFTYIASFGIFTAASYNTSQGAKNMFGHLAYFLEGIRDLGVVQPQHVKVTAGDDVYEGDYIFGGVTNSLSVGGVVKLGKDHVDLNDGLFEVVLVKHPKDVGELSKILIGIANRDLSDSSVFEFFKSPEVTFESEEDFSWTLDGEEAAPGKKVTIKNIKSGIKIIR